MQTPLARSFQVLLVGSGILVTLRGKIFLLLNDHGASLGDLETATWTTSSDIGMAVSLVSTLSCYFGTPVPEVSQKKMLP